MMLRKARMFVLLLAACFPAAAYPLGPGDAAPGFSLPDIHGGHTVSLAEFEGKVVYLDFWASWCGPCRKSLPLYEELNSRISGEKFAIIAVNLDEDPIDARRFLEAHPVTYTVVLDPAGKVAGQWRVPAMPSSYLIGPGQRVVRAWAGFKPSHLEEIEHEILAAIPP
jgi:thiol-disulfide isomerase/thioredoxin